MVAREGGYLLKCVEEGFLLVPNVPPQVSPALPTRTRACRVSGALVPGRQGSRPSRGRAQAWLSYGTPGPVSAPCPGPRSRPWPTRRWLLLPRTREGGRDRGAFITFTALLLVSWFWGVCGGAISPLLRWRCMLICCCHCRHLHCHKHHCGSVFRFPNSGRDHLFTPTTTSLFVVLLFFPGLGALHGRCGPAQVGASRSLPPGVQPCIFSPALPPASPQFCPCLNMNCGTWPPCFQGFGAFVYAFFNAWMYFVPR